MVFHENTSIIRIVKRFSSIILGQFYGHTHYDEFSLLYNNHSEAISVAYTAPSLTPHDGLNPGYRIYHVDGKRQDSSHVLLDHETYYFNLDELNAESEHNIKYKMEYSAKSSLEMKDLTPESWSQYVNELVVDDSKWEEFHQHYTRHGPASQKKSSLCSGKCKQEIICRLVTFDSGDQTMCHAVKLLISQNEFQTDENDNWWEEDF